MTSPQLDVNVHKSFWSTDNIKLIMGAGVLFASIVATFTIMQVKTNHNETAIVQIEEAITELEDNIVVRFQSSAPWTKDRGEVYSRIESLEEDQQRILDKLDRISYNQAMMLNELRRIGGVPPK